MFGSMLFGRSYLVINSQLQETNSFLSNDQWFTWFSFILRAVWLHFCIWSRINLRGSLHFRTKSVDTLLSKFRLSTVRLLSFRNLRLQYIPWHYLMFPLFFHHFLLFLQLSIWYICRHFSHCKAILSMKMSHFGSMDIFSHICDNGRRCKT